MAENIEYDYSIKYRVIKLDKNKYILFPSDIKKGELFGYDFISEDETVPILDRPKSLKGKYVMGAVYTIDDLRILYDDDDSDVDDDFLGEFFYTDTKDKILYVETDDKNEIKDTLEIDLSFLQEKEESGVYVYNKENAAIILNEDILRKLRKVDDLKELKLLLEKYHKLINAYKKLNETKGLTRVKLVNGKIDEIEVDREVQSGVFPKGTYNEEPDINEEVKKDNPVPSDFTYQGLRNKIKEYVFGQDAAIDTFAQKLFMNVTAEEGEPIDSILLVGPTGVGKTETVEQAGKYLEIPYFSFNAANLNAEGIVGTSIENVLSSLYEMAGEDLKRAQRGIVFFDEFDKLNDSELDTKKVLKNIFLTFNGGGKFPIVNSEKVSLVFDTLMTNKVYAGVFQRIADNKKHTIGFGEQPKYTDLTESDIRKRIIDNGYFSLEELSRISTILPYYELDRETKIRILKESKLSTLAQKRKRYKRQFGLDIETPDEFVDAVIEKLDKSETGMRSLNNIIKQIMDCAEKEIILNPTQYKKLVLTRKTVDDPTNFDLS